ncbi:MAG: plasmid recombination protein [Lachnospiraceae bacterium]|nr:plasmid recombination protein [Lachnospiraceae bacterium]
MTEISASFSTGHTAYHHDIREGDLPKNVDPKLSRYNVTLVDRLQGRTVEQYTNERLQPVIDEYNRKQKRNDRKIKIPYSEWHRKYSKSKSRKTSAACPLVYEAVYQLGDHETLGKVWYDSDQKSMAMHSFFKREYQIFLEHLQKYYPHLEVVWAVIHMDEPNGTPHLHIAYQPIGEDYKQGLPVQVSLGRALSLDGIERVESRKEAEENGGYQLKRFYRKMEDFAKRRVLSKNVETILGNSVELKERIEGREHEEPQIYAYRIKKMEKELEYVSLWEELLAKRDLEQIQEQVTMSNCIVEDNDMTIVEQTTAINQNTAIIKNQEAAIENNSKTLNDQDEKIRSFWERLDHALKEIIPRWLNAYRELQKRLDHWFNEEQIIYRELIKKTDQPVIKARSAVKTINNFMTGERDTNSLELSNAIDMVEEATEEIEEIVGDYEP